MTIYDNIIRKKQAGKKQLAILIDPDKAKQQDFAGLLNALSRNAADIILIGGSLITHDGMDECIDLVRKETDLPLVIFPGNTLQVNAGADAILLLSLISGRNPEMLIGKHVVAAPYIRKAGLEVIPTGYMLIESGTPTAALYMSNSLPIPSAKPEIAACTAMAGEMLGLKMIYLDAGSGARECVPVEMIGMVRKAVDLPLMAGGGIRNGGQATAAWNAGADIVVVGNAVESDPGLVDEFVKAKDKF